MAKNKVNGLQRLVQKFASTQAGARLFSGFLHHIDQACLQASRGRISVTEIFTGNPMILITTRGARSGLMRRLPVLCYKDTQVDGRLLVVAANWGKGKLPGWYYNMKANPRVWGLIDGKERAYTANEAADKEYAHFWGIAQMTFPGLAAYQARAGERRIPIMVLNPASDNEDLLKINGS